MIFFLIFLCLHLHISKVFCQNCLSDGICNTESFFLGEAVFVNSSVTCRNLCQNYNGAFECNYYTYCDETCYGFADCLNLDSVVGCRTGQAGCDYCGIDGVCQGPQLGRLRTDAMTCWSTCNQDPGCLWYVYNDLDTDCILMNNCDYFAEGSCQGCKVYEKSCPAPMGTSPAQTTVTTPTSTSTMTTMTLTGPPSGIKKFFLLNH